MAIGTDPLIFPIYVSAHERAPPTHRDHGYLKTQHADSQATRQYQWLYELFMSLDGALRVCWMLVAV